MSRECRRYWLVSANIAIEKKAGQRFGEQPADHRLPRASQANESQPIVGTPVPHVPGGDKSRRIGGGSMLRLEEVKIASPWAIT